MHTFDLVVLAVEKGSGRRSGMLSNIHLGALDPVGEFGEPGEFVMVGQDLQGDDGCDARLADGVLPDHRDGAATTTPCT